MSILNEPSFCFIILILFFVLLILIVYILVKKYFLLEIQDQNVNEFKEKTIRIFTDKGYKVRYGKKGKIIIEKNSFTATGLIFEQKQSDLIVYRHSSSTNTADIIMVVGFLISGFLIPSIIALIIEFKSKNFATNEVLPILKEYKKYDRKCIYCNRNIPVDAVVCPYCGKR